MSNTKILDGRKVALVCQYFPPEGGAAANRMDFFKHWLHKHGAEVVVVTAMPNYPDGFIHKEYRGHIWLIEPQPWGKVLRSWCYASPNRSAVRRLINYFTFMVTSMRWLGQIRKCDVVVFSSGPMFAGFAAFLSAKLFGVKVILDARDLWPDRIWESGAIQLPKAVMNLLRLYENFMYKNSALITCVTQGVCDAIQKRVGASVPVELLRNCDQNTHFNYNRIKTSKESNETIKIVEAGTIGWAQSPENLTTAFKEVLSRGNEYISLKFAGSGPRVEGLKESLKDLEKASYVGNLPQDGLWSLLYSSDIGVVTLRKSEHNEMTVSRRVYDYARAGLAIIYCGGGEGAEIVEKIGAGIVVPPENSSALSDAIEQIAKDKESLSHWKKRSKLLLEGEFSQQAVGMKLVKLVHKLLNRTHKN